LSHRIGRGQVPASAFFARLGTVVQSLLPNRPTIREVSRRDGNRQSNRLQRMGRDLCRTRAVADRSPYSARGHVMRGQGFRVGLSGVLVVSHLSASRSTRAGGRGPIAARRGVRQPAAPGTVRLEHYAVVKRVFHLSDESQLKPWTDITYGVPRRSGAVHLSRTRIVPAAGEGV